MSKRNLSLGLRIVLGLIFLAIFLLVIFDLPRASSSQSRDRPSRAPLNPAFINYMKSRAQGAKVPMTPDGHAFGLIPSPHLIPTAALRPAHGHVYTQLPAYYDLRTQNKLTPVRNQGQCGSCWAFAAYGALESSLMPAEATDYSENDLIQNHGYSIGPCEGGWPEMALGYLARWQGPINEADNPYPYSFNMASGVAMVRKHMQNAIFLPNRLTPADDPPVKEAVMTYGAIQVGMEWCVDAYNATFHSYFNDGNYPILAGHAVCIVGWDDNYPATNFNKTAPGDGAYIVRNSWGTAWGEAGYFYVSYYDVSFGIGHFGPITAEPTDNYISVYQYDPLGWVTSWGYTDETGWYTGWGANIFTARDRRPVTAVSFYAETADTSYEIDIYTDISPGVPRSGNLQCTTSGTTEYAGYYTILLPTAVPLWSGQKFSVVVKFTTPTFRWPIPVEEYFPGSTDAATSSPGQSFVDRYGTAGAPWLDVSADSHKTNICIKAFTGPSQPSGTITVTSPGPEVTWYRGGVYTILWTKDEAPSTNVVIQLMRGSTAIKNVSDLTANDGSYNWKIPGGLIPRSDYFVRVKTRDGRVKGDSALFSIAAPYFTLTSPTPGTTWYKGETRTIAWSATGTAASKVTILLMHGSTVIRTIATGAPNSGSYNWKIPSGTTSRKDYYVKIRTTDGVAQGSSGALAIQAPTIEILWPSEGTAWLRGYFQTVEWLALGPQDDHVNIVLRRNGVKIRDIVLGTENDGYFGWIVPSELVVGGGYEVKIMTTDGLIKRLSAEFYVDDHD